MSQQFTATVTGTGSPAQTVTWSIDEEAHHAGTTIAGGVLNIDPAEELTTLTVRAASTADPTQSGTATVTVSGLPPTVTGVTVTPPSVSVAKGMSQQFTATVTGTGSPAQTVSWTIDGTVAIGTSISTSGLLTIDAMETAESLSVRAASTVDTDENASAAVTIFEPSVTVTLSGGVTVNLRYVPATPDGGFQRDSGISNISTISAGYWMGETAVTQGLFEAVMGSGVRPGNFTANPEDRRNADGWKKLPVERVSWYDAITFCNKLSIKDGKTPVYSVTVSSVEVDWDNAAQNLRAGGYRLPTEMEWMWAAMGATEGGPEVQNSGYAKGYAGSAEGSGVTNIGKYAWYKNAADTNGGHANSKTHEVGKKLANELGLLDMSGNVEEWCWDWYAAGYGTGAKNDYTGPAGPATSRILRGGCWDYDTVHCSVASRDWGGPHYGHLGYSVIGFRVVCP
jgi:formylglycine-generating enzyme required for sulfatase activity